MSSTLAQHGREILEKVLAYLSICETKRNCGCIVLIRSTPRVCHWCDLKPVDKVGFGDVGPLQFGLRDFAFWTFRQSWNSDN